MVANKSELGPFTCQWSLAGSGLVLTEELQALSGPEVGRAGSRVQSSSAMWDKHCSWVCVCPR